MQKNLIFFDNSIGNAHFFIFNGVHIYFGFIRTLMLLIICCFFNLSLWCFCLTEIFVVFSKVKTTELLDGSGEIKQEMFLLKPSILELLNW